MIQIACNSSSALLSLISSRQVNVDYIKMGAYGDFEEQFSTVRSLRSVLLHGLGYSEHSGMRNFGDIDFERVNNLIVKCASPHYGLHLAIKNSNVTPNMSDEEIYSHMSTQIQIFKKSLSVPLLLENVPDSPQDRTVFDHHPYASSGQIARILIENEVGLLLDLTHAKITALCNGWDVHGYLSELPLNLVGEIHVNGSGYDENGDPADTHQAMEDEDYELLDWVLTYARPKIVTLEYNGIESESEELISLQIFNQLKELGNICLRA